MRKQYMGAGNMLHGGSFLNLQYIYGTLSNAGGENPLNFAKMNANPAEWYMIATNATTGKPKYFTRSDLASGRLPRADGLLLYPGGLQAHCD